MADAAVACVLAFESPQGLAIRADDLIDGEDQHRTAGRLGPLHHRARHVPVRGGIELEPHGCAARCVDVLDRRGGQGRQDLQVPLRAGGARDREFSFRVKRPQARDGREDDGGVPGGTQQADRRVDAGDVDQPAGSHLIPGESRPIGAQRRVVVHAGCQVPVVRGWQFLARDGLEVEDVERVAGRRDDVVTPRHLSQCAQEWARRQEFQELAPIRPGRDVHGALLSFVHASSCPIHGDE